MRDIKGIWRRWHGILALGLLICSPPVAAQSLPSPSASAAQLLEPEASIPDILELKADQQFFNQNTEVFEATGQVELHFRRSILRADSMRIDIRQRLATATGNVSLTLGEQRIQGESLTYDFGREEGVFERVTGQIKSTSLAADTQQLSKSTDPVPLTPRPNATPKSGFRLIRFTADRIRVKGNTWNGDNVRLTNDPVTPPELEIQAPNAELVLEEDGTGVLTAQGGSLVFDQVSFLPLPARFRLDRFQRQLPIEVKSDGGEPGRGLMAQINLELVDDPKVSFILSPQLYFRRLFGQDPNNRTSSGSVGAEAQLRVQTGNGELLSVLAQLDGLVLNELASRLRSQLQYSIPTGDGGTVTYFYSYRQLFFNGLLDFQTVQNRLGAGYASPVYALGDSQIRFRYQVSGEYIDALGQFQIDSDPETAIQNAKPLQLPRLSIETSLDRTFPLWLEPLSTVAPEQLRYSRDPIQPGLWLITGVSGNQSFYGSGFSQTYLVGKVGVQAILGRLLADSFDYTDLNITYSNGLLSGSSPFLYDRITTREQLVLGLMQQIYGPLQMGAETTLDLQSGKEIDTTFTLGYNRRTYGLTVRFSPVRQSGAVEFRIDDFNWNSAGE